MQRIIERYLLREIALTFIGVSLLLVVMLFSSTFIRLLAETLEGDYPAGILFSLFALKGVGNIVFILPFAFFLAVLLALGRLYKDNEITALTACGAGPGRLFSGVFYIGLLVSLGIAYLSLFFGPWVSEHAVQLQDEARAKQEIEGVVPGRFNSFGPGRPMVYAESYDEETRRIHGVFVQLEKEGEITTLRAASAYERVETDGTRYLVLLDGYRYEGRLKRRDYRIVRFAEHGLLIKERKVVASERRKKTVPSAELWASGGTEDWAELHWRLALPVSALLLALLAVPMSKTSPRRGRYAGLVLGIGVYMVYNNLLIAGRSAITKEEVPSQLGLWWVHLLVAGLVVLLTWRQQRVRRPRRVGGKAQ